MGNDRDYQFEVVNNQKIHTILNRLKKELEFSIKNEDRKLEKKLRSRYLKDIVLWFLDLYYTIDRQGYILHNYDVLYTLVDI